MAAFGPDFKAGGSVLAILLVGELVSALVGPVAQILIAASKERTLQHLAWVNLAMNSVLYVWLCNLWGATGAAVATSAGVVFINFTVAVVGLGLLRRAN